MAQLAQKPEFLSIGSDIARMSTDNGANWTVLGNLTELSETSTSTTTTLSSQTRSDININTNVGVDITLSLESIRRNVLEKLFAGKYTFAGIQTSSPQHVQLVSNAQLQTPYALDTVLDNGNLPSITSVMSGGNAFTANTEYLLYKQGIQWYIIFIPGATNSITNGDNVSILLATNATAISGYTVTDQFQGNSAQAFRLQLVNETKISSGTNSGKYLRQYETFYNAVVTSELSRTIGTDQQVIPITISCSTDSTGSGRVFEQQIVSSSIAQTLLSEFV